jgi:hypothetical protein
MFQAVSLEPSDAGVEMAKVLAFSAAGLIAGVERVEGRAGVDGGGGAGEAGNRELREEGTGDGKLGAGIGVDGGASGDAVG